MRFLNAFASVFFICQCSVAFAQDVDVDQVKKAFEDIPRDLQITFNPALLDISFPQNDTSSVVVHAGAHIPVNATANPPIFGLNGTTSNSKGPFVVALIDPDGPFPQNPTEAQVRHFLGGNFVPTKVGNASVTTNIGAPLSLNLRNTTPAVTEFMQPAPPAGSDPHRYIFLLFDQSAEFTNQTLVSPSTSIILFNISSFAAAVGLGDPVAGTFMWVAPDASA